MAKLSFVALAALLVALASSASAYSAPEPTGEIECVACEFIVQKLEGLLESNATMSEIEAELAKLCGDLPASLSAVCNDVVDNYLPELIQALLNKEDPQQVCTSVGLCTSAQVEAPEDECSICTIIVSEVYSLLQNNATESEIISALNRICSLLPSNDVSICNNLVSSYLPQIIQMIENDFTPTEICTDLGLCSSARAVAAPQGAECSICELIVGEVEKLLAANHTEAEIEGLLEKICAALPGSFGQACDVLVETYLPEIIASLENDVPPQEVCTKLGICTSAVTVAAPQDECSICELIVGEVESLLAANHTESEIISALDKICAALPGSFGATCASLVNNYLPQIIMELENDLPANVVCQKIGICTSMKQVGAPQSECSICELLVGEIEAFVASNKSESFIIMELEKICNLLPGSLGQTCDALVEADLPAIIEHIEAGNPPETVCTKLGRCTSAPKKVAAPQSECSICELLVGEIEAFVASNKSESFIIMELEKICNLLPGSLGQTCDALVEADLPAIIEHIEAGNPPETVCTKLGRCTSVAAALAAKPKLSPEVCQICELVVTEAEKLVSGRTLNNTAIEDELKSLCGDLPSQYQIECNAIVTLFAMTIIEDIENGVAPETICTNYKLCSSSSVAPARVHVAAAVRL